MPSIIAMTGVAGPAGGGRCAGGLEAGDWVHRLLHHWQQPASRHAVGPNCAFVQKVSSVLDRDAAIAIVRERVSA